MLEGKIALITGAARGIGAEIARTLSGYGAFVIINYNRSKEPAEQILEEIRKKGGDGAVYGCDVSDYSACREMIDALLKEYHRIDILVNNAGITKDNLLMRMKEEDFDTVIDTNLKGAFNTTSLLSRSFLKQKSGTIINISSVSGVMGNAGQANYSASKAGLIGLTKSTARELGSRGITANVIAPGMIDTDMTSVLSEQVKKNLTDQIPMKRIGAPKEVAEAVAFLASDKAAYITGQVLCVDGGMAM